MTTDSINDEILRIKRELAERFSNDLDLIIADAKSRERNAISLPPRPFKAKQTDEPKPWIAGISIDVSTPAAQ